MQAGWHKDTDRAAVDGVGRFCDAAGDTFVDVATANVFLRTGRLKPVPANIAREPDFKRVFGNVLPNAIPVESCANREWVQLWHDGMKCVLVCSVLGCG